MESLKSIYHNLSDMNKMLIKILLGIICGLIIIFILVFVIKLVVGSNKSFESIEQTIYSATVRYYDKNKQELPDTNEEIVLSLDKLIDAGYMKELSKYVNKNVTCSGNVTVINNNDKYIYLPYLDCNKDYKTKILNETILENNKIVESGSGLYQDINNDYLFKGEYINNYVSFANQTWRIIKLDQNGSVRLLMINPLKKYKNSKWDDRYNIEKKSPVGINDYSISRIKEKLDEIYNDDEIFNDNQRALISSQDLCTGSRTINSEDLSDTEECSSTLEDQYLGLLQANEYIAPSLDNNCNTTVSASCLNYNYLASIYNTFWTITPNADNSYEVFAVGGGLFSTKASSKADILITLNLTSKTQIEEGEGSLEKPYVIKDYSKK